MNQQDKCRKKSVGNALVEPLRVQINKVGSRSRAWNVLYVLYVLRRMKMKTSSVSISSTSSHSQHSQQNCDENKDQICPLPS